jgi:GH15 family glucan-1,4-alpha-glucosidase
MSEKYPQIADYGLLSDCQTAALVSRDGSIDWLCLPRFDSGSTFGRILDWDRGGRFSLRPVGDEEAEAHRDYLPDTLVLQTTFRVEGGAATLTDLLTISPDGPSPGAPRLLRVVEGVRGSVEFELDLMPRFDYGEVDAWVQHRGRGIFTAIGGDDGLLISSDAELEADRHRLAATFVVRPGDRVRTALTFLDPAELQDDEPAPPGAEELDRSLEETVAHWRDWAKNLSMEGPDAPGAIRSAIVLKGLTYQHSGALVAAPTTSLPESAGGERNWDYRFSWIRDSALAVTCLADLGADDEVDACRRFMERSAAGNAEDIQILYGVGGERRLDELQLDLDGYRGARPVRVGNGAAGQLQLDAPGQLVHQSWLWYERGHEPDDDYWRFVVDLADLAADRWKEPDRGIWEWREAPLHFTHSKVLCWVALDRALALAERCMRKAPERRWRKARDEIRRAIERRGYDRERGCFVRAFDDPGLDGALLRLPAVGFIDYGDERMIRTVDAIREELDWDGLIKRYDADDGLPGQEGAFLACSFWLVEVLARQSRTEEARKVFDRAVETANGLGLFAEEYDPAKNEMRGNFPQALTHLSHIEAAMALNQQTRQGPSAQRPRVGEGLT